MNMNMNIKEIIKTIKDTIYGLFLLYLIFFIIIALSFHSWINEVDELASSSHLSGLLNLKDYGCIYSVEGFIKAIQLKKKCVLFYPIQTMMQIDILFKAEETILVIEKDTTYKLSEEELNFLKKYNVINCIQEKKEKNKNRKKKLDRWHFLQIIFAIILPISFTILFYTILSSERQVHCKAINTLLLFFTGIIFIFEILIILYLGYYTIFVMM